LLLVAEADAERMSFLSKLFSKRRSPTPALEAATPHLGSLPRPICVDRPPGEARVDWRTSEGHQRLLLNFTFPNTCEAVPRWVDWNGLLGESLDSALQRLRADGALLPVTAPRLRILYRRTASELKRMCRERGLKVSGTKEQMAERLASLDPSGLVLGYPGELLMCSGEAEQIAKARREAWEQSQLDDPDLRNVFGRQEFEAEKERLRQRFLGKGYPEPSDDDVKWGMLNRRALKHAAESNLGLCRNTYLMMADFRSRRGKLRNALRFYLIVCAFDLNGAQNGGGASSETLRKFPLFDPKTAILAPAVVAKVVDLAERLAFSPEDLWRAFLESASLMSFPLAPEKAWSALSLAIEGKIDLDDQPRCFELIRSSLA
jgi:hypothetical protein